MQCNASDPDCIGTGSRVPAVRRVEGSNWCGGVVGALLKSLFIVVPTEEAGSRAELRT